MIVTPTQIMILIITGIWWYFLGIGWALTLALIWVMFFYDELEDIEATSREIYRDYDRE